MNCLSNNLIRLHLKFIFHVYRGGCYERMYTPSSGVGQRLSGTIDVCIQCARERTDTTLFNGVGDSFHCLEITGTGNREASLNDIHAHPLELASDTQLLLSSH